jgi:hypothetical protein
MIECLFITFMDRDIVGVSHQIKLVDAANSPVSQDQSTSLQMPVTVFSNSSRYNHEKIR